MNAIYDNATKYFTASRLLDLPREGQCAKCGKVCREHVDRITRGDGKEHSVRFWCKDCRTEPPPA